ncbi:PA domain-containing protein [Nonomuraea sp. NPDC004580]|uniref:PA domain-containing protein n=1 Tax=Nonomuraea sp. NPDC004580 TaxID=3154552 RepID=UPI0033AD2DB2
MAGYRPGAANGPAVLDRVSPDAKSYVPGEDFHTFQPSPPGDVTAQVQGVDLTLPPTPAPSSTSGCEEADFAGFVAGNIALIQRGTSPFAQKVRNAGFAGASAVIVFNEGQPGRTDSTPLDLGEWRAGGIFTGAEGTKTPEEAAMFGGTAGAPYDPCYHQACDTLANVNATVFDVNADAIADSTARFAFDLRGIPPRTAP